MFIARPPSPNSSSFRSETCSYLVAVISLLKELGVIHWTLGAINISLLAERRQKDLPRVSGKVADYQTTRRDNWLPTPWRLPVRPQNCGSQRPLRITPAVNPLTREQLYVSRRREDQVSQYPVRITATEQHCALRQRIGHR